MGKFKKYYIIVRYIILLSLFTNVLVAKSQNQTSFFKTLRIGYQYGDEAMTYEEILFKKVGNKIMGSISYPNTDKSLLSNVELNIFQQKTIDSFLYLAEKFTKEKCEEKEASSYIQYYTIIQDNDTIKVYRFCDWHNLTFFNIKRSIFGSYLKSLETKKVSVTAEYFKILKGKWKESTQLDKLGLTSICELDKLDQGVDTSDCIEFINPNKLIIHRKKRKIHYDYHLEFSGQNTYIVFNPVPERNRIHLRT